MGPCRRRQRADRQGQVRVRGRRHSLAGLPPGRPSLLLCGCVSGVGEAGGWPRQGEGLPGEEEVQEGGGAQEGGEALLHDAIDGEGVELVAIEAQLTEGTELLVRRPQVAHFRDRCQEPWRQKTRAWSRPLLTLLNPS